MQFNIELEDTDAFEHEEWPWQQSHVLYNRPPAMIIEFLLSSRELAEEDAIEIYDEEGRRRAFGDGTVCSSGGVKARREYSPDVILERWRIALDGSPEASQDDWETRMPKVYKSCIVFFRSLFTMTTLLPARSYGKWPRRLSDGIPNLHYRIHQDFDGSKHSDPEDLLTMLCDTPSKPLETYSFESVRSPIGNFSLSVSYRTDLNFRKANAEAASAYHYERDHDLQKVEDERYRQPADSPMEYRSKSKPMFRSLQDLSQHDDDAISRKQGYDPVSQSFPAFSQTNRHMDNTTVPEQDSSYADSESQDTDEDNISNFLRLLERKKRLESFRTPPQSPAMDKMTRSNLIELWKFSRLRDEHSSLSEDISFHINETSPHSPGLNSKGLSPPVTPVSRVRRSPSSPKPLSSRPSTTSLSGPSFGKYPPVVTRGLSRRPSTNSLPPPSRRSPYSPARNLSVHSLSSSPNLPRQTSKSGESLIAESTRYCLKCAEWRIVLDGACVRTYLSF